MAKKGAAALAVAAAVAVIAAGVKQGVPWGDTAIRVPLAAVAGALVGWLVFGILARTTKNDDDVNRRT